MNEEKLISYVRTYGLFSLEKEDNCNFKDFSVNYKYNVRYCGRRIFFFFMRSYKQYLQTTVYTEEENPILLLNQDILKEFIYMCNNFILRIHSDFNKINKRYYINYILMDYDNEIILLNVDNSELKNVKITIHLDNYYTISVKDKLCDRFYSLNELLQCEILKPFRRTTIGDLKKFFGIL